MNVVFYKDRDRYVSYPLPVDDSIENFTDLNINSVYMEINQSLIFNEIGFGEGKISISRRGAWYLEIYDNRFLNLPNGENTIYVKIINNDGEIIIENKTILYVYEKYEKNEKNEEDDVTPLDLLSSKNYTTKEKRNERFNICKQCPRLFKPTKTCKECGCFMGLKTWLKDASCPIGKW